MYYNVVQSRPYNSRPFTGYNGIGGYGTAVPTLTPTLTAPSIVSDSPMIAAEVVAPAPAYVAETWNPDTHWSTLEQAGMPSDLLVRQRFADRQRRRGKPMNVMVQRRPCCSGKVKLAVAAAALYFLFGRK